MKRLLLVLLTCFIAQLVSAQQKSLVAFGVYDRITQANIDGARIELLYQDTIPVKYQTIQQGNGVYKLKFDYHPGVYTILIDKDGYTTGMHTFSMTNYRNSMKGEGNIYLDKERVLKEVSVSATKIKMVMHGDTIVYNADAFQLAEGSMLDALVAMLPGAELKDGEIKVNGKKIESLMVNGEDFFRGNPKVALENLPAYTVKKIKVYDRAANDDYLKGEAAKKLKADEHMAMDVVLKKEYSRGFLGNVDAGYGLPGNMYQGKAFGLGYFAHSRIAAFANVNNIKNTQTGSTGGWGGGWDQTGEMDIQMGGLDYLYSRGKMKYAANATLTHEEPLVVQKTSSTNFYTSGNTFGRSLSRTTDEKLHLMSNHNFQYSGERVYAEVKPQLDYMHNNYTRLRRSAELSAEPLENYRLQALDSLFSPSWQTSRYASLLLNRHSRETDGVDRWLIAGADAKATIAFPKTGKDVLKLTAGGKYRNDDNESQVSINRITGVSGQSDNTYQDTRYVSNNYDLYANVAYRWNYWPYKERNWSIFIVEPHLEARRNHYDRANTIYQLHETSDNQTDAIGIIPPSAISAMQLSIDRDNSYNSVFSQNHYKPGVDITWAYVPSATSNKQVEVDVNIDDDMTEEHLHYNKRLVDTTLTRFSHSFLPSVELRYIQDGEHQKHDLKLSYKFRSSLPSIYNRIGTVNSSDPLNIYVDNPDLNRPLTNSLNFSYNRYDKTKYRNLTLTTSYNHVDRAIANAKYHDRQTGVNTWKPENIDGNWNTNASVNFTTPLGKKRLLDFSNNASVSYNHSVDYASETDIPIRNAVGNLSLNENASLSYKLGKHLIGGRLGAMWQHSRSEYSEYGNFDAINTSATAYTTINLPQNWQFTTDMNVISRNGYTDDLLNKTYCVWNASIAKTMLKGNLTLRLNAVDMLAQVSSIQYSINAQGKTETWTNSLPRYVMLHLTYKFNSIPKKK